jgi:hypothetical protein
MKKGDKVIIVYNPHHKGAEQIIGTIKDYKGERICGSDIYYVEYTNPADGKTHVMPLGHLNLQATSEADLNKLAEHHESLAREYRELAKSAADKE